MNALKRMGCVTTFVIIHMALTYVDVGKDTSSAKTIIRAMVSMYYRNIVDGSTTRALKCSEENGRCSHICENALGTDMSMLIRPTPYGSMYYLNISNFNTTKAFKCVLDETETSHTIKSCCQCF